ncbi:hypothetical protein VNO78_07988 [Psophocarpus tetragonolobus]|uniref:Uncharacterized protein n=1 Tax=Psophocarpus tetragonolobus TaxID=3891 RepID=A0AAN9SX55_PSOTE
MIRDDDTLMAEIVGKRGSLRGKSLLDEGDMGEEEGIFRATRLKQENTEADQIVELGGKLGVVYGGKLGVVYGENVEEVNKRNRGKG